MKSYARNLNIWLVQSENEKQTKMQRVCSSQQDLTTHVPLFFKF